MKSLKKDDLKGLGQVVMTLTMLLALIQGNSCAPQEDVPECCYDCSCYQPCIENEDFTYPYTDTLFLSDSFLSYWYFPVGSWWLYKRVDTTADIYDKATVVEQEKGIACNCKLLGDICRERAWVKIDHSVSPLQKPGERNMKVTLDTDLRIDWVFSHSGTSLLGGGVPHFTLPFTAAEESGLYTMHYDQQNSFSTSKYTFKNPVTYHYQNPNVPADSVARKTNILVKNVGWVYFYHRDLSEWELVDYHIAH